jgi:hypothetical protein
MPATFTEFFTIGTVGLVMGFLQSYVIEFIPAWDNVAPQYKRLIMMGIAVALATGVQAVNTYVPEAVITDLNPWYIAIVAGIQLISAEVTHQKTKSANAG